MHPLTRIITRHLLGLPCTARNLAHTRNLMLWAVRGSLQVAALVLAAVAGCFVTWLFAALLFSL